MASLNDTGAQLGRDIGGGDDVNLRLCAEDGYSRTFASDGYLRVNPTQVAAGQADDPASPANSLDAWENYDHDDVDAGSQLEVSGGYSQVTVDFTKPAGYDLAPAIMAQRAYIKDTGETEINGTALAVDPLVSPDQTVLLSDDASDTIDLSGFEGSVVAIAIIAEFDDSVDVHESAGYTAAAGQDALTGATPGVAVLVRSDTPSIDSITQSPTPPNCSLSDTPDHTVHITAEGPSTIRAETREGVGAWGLHDASVAAGASSFSNPDLDPGDDPDYRIRYNDIDGQGTPGPWSNILGALVDCELA